MTNYIGRFAPSPSGPLHFGSLVTALGSYFQAKSSNGQWLVRIEDIDPPREVAGASELILNTLIEYGLDWDGDVRYQSEQLDFYQAQINQWLNDKQAYFCQCTRKQIKEQGGYYLGNCRDKHLNEQANRAIRIKLDDHICVFDDIKHGQLSIDNSLAQEDFIIKRSDGLFAYNLAVVLDDIDQGITEVVRGADLIEATGRQLCLYQLLSQHKPRYLHLPLAIGDDGRKLSKQNHAKGINQTPIKETLIDAMRFLGHCPPKYIQNERIKNIIEWGVNHWSIAQLPNSLAVHYQAK